MALLRYILFGIAMWIAIQFLRRLLAPAPPAPPRPTDAAQPDGKKSADRLDAIPDAEFKEIDSKLTKEK